MTSPITKPDDKLPAQPTTQDLLGFGVDHVAYIRPVKIMNRSLFAIHAADGTPISVVETEILAHEVVARHDLESVRVH